MVSGSPVTLSVSTTQPMVFSHSMGKNPFVFPIGIPNHDTQPIPWASNNFYLGMQDMSSHLPSFVSSSYVNPSFGSGGMMPPFSPFSFGGGHVPQPNPMVGGWNPPSSRPNPSFTFPGESSQMGGIYSYYIPYICPSSDMLVHINSFLMVDLLLSSSVSSGGSRFYIMGNPLHGVPSFGGNIYPHLSNPCHVAFSSQASSSVMIPLQPFMNQFGGGYHPAEKAMVYTRTLPSLQPLKISLYRKLGLKFHNQSLQVMLESQVQSLQVILALYDQPLLVMLEIGQQTLQVMLKTRNHPLHVMLGA
jgi:hypothetical protein